MFSYPRAPVSFSFDIGHASIGWAVKAESSGSKAEPAPILGCGALIFPKDDCQNHERAAFRRQRRHIAATRNRVKRLREHLTQMGALSLGDAKAQREAASGVMAPWLLAARALNGCRLSWLELWQVLRWYAHNRGYDGNAAWAGAEAEIDPEDTEKVKQANRLMEEAPRTETMAETICKVLGVALESDSPPMGKYFKGENAAFPREVVVGEVARILQIQGHLPGCDADFRRRLLDDLSEEEKRHFRLPQRYHGGLLFGQMIPRFDNRIISKCAISGKKAPLKHCPEYYRFRWGLLLANLRVETPREGVRALLPRERADLHERMKAKGFFTKSELKKAVEEVTGCSAAPLDAHFFTREAEDALVLDPVHRELSAAKWAPLWASLPARERRIFANQLFKSGRATPKQWREALSPEAKAEFDRSVDKGLEAANKHRRKKAPLSREEFLATPIQLATKATGRAPYSRDLLKQAFAEVMEGMHPHARTDKQPPSAAELRDGCLSRTPEVLNRERERKLDEMTNNHLVRQRILLFRRLLEQLYERFADREIERVQFTTIEVARDLVEYSGMNAKEKAALFSSKAKPFQEAEKVLRKGFAELGIGDRITYSLIRKARIAIAQNWTCPYTGRRFGPLELRDGTVDVDHIIPRSRRPSDSLDNLVVAFSEANKRKGNRLPLELIQADGGEGVATGGSATNGQIVYESRFREIVDGFAPKRDPRSLNYANDEDFIRWRRKQNLLLERYDERDADFTPAALTVTSHLNKLAALEARKFFHAEAEKAGLEEKGSAEHRVGHVQGSVTHYFRTRWGLLHALGEVCPEVIDKANGDSRLLPKGEIRTITHLHHAVDAIALALVRTALGGVVEKQLCEAILRRRARPEERLRLEATGLFDFDAKGKHHPKDLPGALFDSIKAALGEKRIVQHVPANMAGMLTEQTQWRVLQVRDDGKAVIQQYGPRDPKTHKRSKKQDTENPKRLLGFDPRIENGKESKLKPRQAAIVIKGNYGIALLPEPEVIPFHCVWKRLDEIAARNDGKRPEILRAGQIIHVPKAGIYQGRWRIHSVKDNTAGVAVDMARPELVKAENRKDGCKMNVLVASLIKAGMMIENSSMIGV